MRGQAPFALVFTALAAVAAGRQNIGEGIFGPPAPGARFGAGIASQGRWLISGAPRDGGGTLEAGEVFVFSLGVGGWGLRQTLHGAGEGGDAFGHAVALDGATLVVGAPFSASATGSPGQVWWFRREGSGFVLAGAIFPSGAGYGDMFGAALDLDGERLVVGAPRHASGGVAGAGEVRVYLRVGASWIEEARLSAPVPRPHARFGAAVALSGERLAVGAPLDEEAGRVGSVRVYVRDAGGWSLEETLVGGAPGAAERLGWSVDLEGDVLVAGAPWAFGGGLARVYERDPGAGFGEVATLVDPELAAGARFADALALSDGLVAVGAPNAARVRLFERTDGGWTRGAALAMTGASEDEEFGAALALAGSRLSVGAPGAAGAQHQSGAVFEYHVRRRRLGRLECLGDGSGTPCPCGNPGGAGEGCASSLGAGATIAAAGSASLAAADLEVIARGLPPGATALLFAARTPLGSGVGAPFADGVLCAGGGAVRIGVGVADGRGSVRWISAPPTGLVAGGVRRFQVAYTDPGGPCGTGMNFTPALAIEVEP